MTIPAGVNAEYMNEQDSISELMFGNCRIFNGTTTHVWIKVSIKPVPRSGFLELSIPSHCRCPCYPVQEGDNQIFWVTHRDSRVEARSRLRALCEILKFELQNPRTYGISGGKPLSYYTSLPSEKP